MLFYLAETSNIILMSGADGGAVPRRLAGAVPDAVHRPLGADRWSASSASSGSSLKTVFVFFMNAMVRSVVPRYRYDQLMRLGWKVFLPTSLVAVALVAGWRVYAPVIG